MNELMRIKHEHRMTYDAISDAIYAKTGRRFSADYLGNVARNEVPLADSLRLHLFDTFRDFGLLPSTHLHGNSHKEVFA